MPTILKLQNRRLVLAILLVLGMVSLTIHLARRPRITRPDLSVQVAAFLKDNKFPTEIDIPIEDTVKRVQIEYGINHDLQEDMQKLFEQYKPDYGAFVAMDARTGEIITLVQYNNPSRKPATNLAFNSDIPAASVFKVVTAAAAIEQRKFSPQTVIPFNGRSHTLYKNHVKKTDYNRWTRYPTLREAFAQSINTVFGKIGVHHLSPAVLSDYARQFGFNQEILSDLPIASASASIPVNDAWALAESASGFTDRNTMSPIHGALIAAAVVNEGVMMSPYLIRSVKNSAGEVLYQSEPELFSRAIEPKTAGEIRALMQETVRRGTSSGIFRSFLRNPRYKDIEVGGKTGSLSARDPAGKCDWWVGYAQGSGPKGDRRIAIAALTINQDYWTVRSSYIARRFIEKSFIP